MRISVWIAMFAAGAVALAGCSSSSEPKKDRPAADTSAQPAPQQEAAAPQKQEAPASFQVHAPATFNVTFDTTRGPVVVEVHRDWAPIGADRFYELAKSGFFDGCRFFRVVPNFVVQFGIAADPAATRKWKDANLVDDPVLRHNLRGTLVYAKTDQPNTRTTQLFINLADNTRSLDPQGFAPFGTITSGMDAVDAIYAGYGEAPQQPLIESQGNAYLQQFPKLDYIRKATIQ